MSERDYDYMMGIKPSEQMWADYLSQMPKVSRAAFIRRAIRDFIAETPRLTAIPIEESPREPIRLQAIQLVIDDEIREWFDNQVPSAMRSYMVRYMIRRYYRLHPDQVQQARFSLDPTGTETAAE